MGSKSTKNFKIFAYLSLFSVRKKKHEYFLSNRNNIFCFYILAYGTLQARKLYAMVNFVQIDAILDSFDSTSKMPRLLTKFMFYSGLNLIYKISNIFLAFLLL